MMSPKFLGSLVRAMPEEGWVCVSACARVVSSARVSEAPGAVCAAAPVFSANVATPAYNKRFRPIIFTLSSPRVLLRYMPLLKSVDGDGILHKIGKASVRERGG